MKFIIKHEKGRVSESIFQKYMNLTRQRVFRND